MTALRLALADDQALVRSGLRALLSAWGDLQVDVEVADGAGLLEALRVRQVDVVLSDAPVPPTVSVKAYNHVLGECGATFFAVKSLAAKLAKDFPKSLTGAPLLMPTDNTALGRSLEQWLVDNEVVGNDDKVLVGLADAAGLPARVPALRRGNDDNRLYFITRKLVHNLVTSMFEIQNPGLMLYSR